MSVINVRSAVVPGTVPADNVLSGRPVSAAHWSSASALVNHLLTCGAQVVCGNAPNVTISGGSSHVFRYYAWPREINKRLAWLIYATTTASADENETITITGYNDTTTARVGYTDNSAAVPVSVIATPLAPILFQEQHDSGAGPGEITLTIDTTSVAVRVMQIVCFEIPRMKVELGNGDLVSANIGAGHAIAQVTESGLYGLAASLEQAKTNLTRAAFSWHTGTVVSSSSGSYVPIFQLPPRVIMPRMSSADGTTGSIKWAARVTGDGIGTAGDVRATAESGATSTLTFSYSGMGWVHGSLTVDREDLTTSTGGQTGRTYGDLVTFEIRRTAGAGNVTIDGICMACSP